jgi:hypothetical protein
MTTIDRLERQVEGWLASTAQPRTPDYFPDLLAQTARTRQRPAWTFLERWLPVSVLTLRRWVPRPFPVRATAVLVALIAALLILIAIVAVGSHRPLPPPFGVAANGVVAFDDAGDIIASDPVSGGRRVLIGGPELDRRPMFSRDGSRLAFLRGTGTHVELVAASADGTRQVVLDAGPLRGDEVFDWSPDGRTILVSIRDPGDMPPVARDTTVRIVPTDGSRLTVVDLGIAATSAHWRPPASAELLFMGSGTDTWSHGLYLATADGRRVTPIVPRRTDVEVGYPEWDPTGQAIAFTEWDTTASVFTARQRVVDVATGTTRTLPLDDSATWGLGAWSNDGSRLVVMGLAKEGVPDAYFGAIIEVRPGGGIVALQPPAPGLTSGAALGVGAGWSPDDRSIVGTPHTASDQPQPQRLWDARTGAVRPAPWAATTSAWQRAAPD